MTTTKKPATPRKPTRKATPVQGTQDAKVGVIPPKAQATEQPTQLQPHTTASATQYQIVFNAKTGATVKPWHTVVDGSEADVLAMVKDGFWWQATRSRPRMFVPSGQIIGVQELVHDGSAAAEGE
jgi:hypothetical protein